MEWLFGGGFSALAASSNTHTITPKIVSDAANETLGGTNKKSSSLTPLLGLLLLVCIAAGIYFQPYWPKAINHAPVNLAKPEIVSQPKPPDQKEPLPVEKINTIPVAKTTTFHDWIDNPDYSLNTALISALKIWGKPIPKSRQVDCHYVETTGLHCVFGKASWKAMLAIDRPAILEFSWTGQEKRHALLTGFGKKQSMVHFKDNMTFPVADALKYWNGYYLMLKPPPIPDVKLMHPHQTSDNVLWLRYLLNSIDKKNATAEQPRFYDDHLVARIKSFQHQHQLPEDGIVGNKTMAHLKNIARTLAFPRLEITD